MLSSLFIAAFASLHLLVAAPASAAPDAARGAEGVRVAQATDLARAEATNRAASAVATGERRRRALTTEKARLRAIYNRQLQELDQIKAQRRSWRRDRQLRDQKAESQATALKLGQVDRELRALQTSLRGRRQGLVTAIDRELAGSPSMAREARLTELRRSVRRSLRPPVRKISIPDDDLDELADPEELLEQIALLEQAEAELARENRELSQRASRYARMAELRDRRQRATDLSELDDDRVRRSTGRVSGDADRGQVSSDEVEDGAAPGGFGGGGGEAPAEPDLGPSLSDVSIVLSDVVDATTQDALRRADRTSDPAAKARAARRAQGQVRARLERLRRSRQRIELHLRRLEK